MSPASAAAARTAARPTACNAPAPVDLEARLRDLLERSPRGETCGLAERLLPTPSSGRPARRPPHEGFYWLQISRWLADSFRLTATAAGRALLDDLQWIQFCVYAVFRVQDDLVDGETADARLAVEANRLLVEASRCAARHFAGDSPFWDVFRDTIDATSRAILTLDRLQRTPERPAHCELELYKDLAACLKIAAAGVSIAAGREGDWRHRISPALDRLAVAAQILDDLWDLSDDLADGRINYVAWYLSRPVFAATPEAIEAVVASNLATTDRLSALLESIAHQLGAAVEQCTSTLCPRTHAYLRDYREGLSTIADRFCRSRCALLATVTRPRVDPAAQCRSPRSRAHCG